MSDPPDIPEMSSLSANEYGYLIAAFTFSFWQPGQFYSSKVWGSNWYKYISEKTWILSPEFNLAIPVIWTLIYGCVGASFFLFWKNKEDLGSDFDAVMSMIITTISITKVWILFIFLIPWKGIFFVASLIPFFLGLSTWVTMWIVLEPYHATDWFIIWLWAPLPIWTFIATFVVGLSIWLQLDDEVYKPELGWGLPFDRNKSETKTL